ncbi:tRNA pseudouridine synthase A [Halogeometricum borinquense DSM 11551]|uniref:tRNA pseudouridine synthase A n=2 Tax=Halogeometricum borinquense TaxID=60847 RepID=E4NLG1_HALBP|nr:tRNA pseudouridine(38-40) synthase TruA [Halogeometricum borinquense]ADQ66057.1 pseudouridylate synthase I [Halogeometricum borinquense DSM 11551]ELY27447.1 tRNA pseudouridine synthase A [Halogeometricum borinquense DSM 11551]RYJ13772.1 tRNA pseudouridine(38-40) synthase TruA [Halogeometricum borinquense]
MRAFRIAYDGRPFYGFQRQPSVPTVEDSIFDALRSLGVLDEDARKPTGYAAAGRTDAGVSALAQTVAFDCPEWCTPRAMNAELPESVRAWAAADVGERFHATHDAARRAYVYDLYAPEADESKAQAAADALTGEHDFHNLTPDDTGTVRDVTVSVEADGEFLVLSVAAGGFPYNLVRRLASIVHSVATGDRPLADIETVLGPETVPGPEGVPTAPAEPLVLERVVYPGVTFERDPEAVESAAGVFEKRRRDGLIRTRVAGRIRRGIEGDSER